MIKAAMDAIAAFLESGEGIGLPIVKGYPRLGRPERTGTAASLLFDGLLPEGRGVVLQVRLDVSCADELALWEVADRLNRLIEGQKEAQTGSFTLKAWPASVTRQEVENDPYRLSAVFATRVRTR